METIRGKHRKDYNSGKGGMIAGNARYKRNARRETRKNRTMGRWSSSRN